MYEIESDLCDCIVHLGIRSHPGPDQRTAVAERERELDSVAASLLKADEQTICELCSQIGEDVAGVAEKTKNTLRGIVGLEAELRTIESKMAALR